MASFLEIEADRAKRGLKLMTGATGATGNATYYPKNTGTSVVTWIPEPELVPAELRQYDVPRPDFVWQVTLLVADLGEDIQTGDQFTYSSGHYSGQTWMVVDVPLDGVQPPTIRAVVKKQ